MYALVGRRSEPSHRAVSPKHSAAPPGTTRNMWSKREDRQKGKIFAGTTFAALIVLGMLINAIPSGAAFSPPPAAVTPATSSGNYEPHGQAPRPYTGGLIGENYNFSWGNPLDYRYQDLSTCTSNPCPYTVATLPANLANATGNNVMIQPNALAIPGILQGDLNGPLPAGSAGYADNYTSCTYAGPGNLNQCREWNSTHAWIKAFGSGATTSVYDVALTPLSATATPTGAPGLQIVLNGSHAGMVNPAAILNIPVGSLPSQVSSNVYLNAQFTVSSISAFPGDISVAFFAANPQTSLSGGTWVTANGATYGSGIAVPTYNQSSGSIIPYDSQGNATRHGLMQQERDGAEFLSVPLSLFSNHTQNMCFNQTSAACPGTDKVLSTLAVGFVAHLPAGFAAANYTINLYGLSLTTYPISPGPTVWHGQSVRRNAVYLNESGVSPIVQTGSGVTAWNDASGAVAPDVYKNQPSGSLGTWYDPEALMSVNYWLNLSTVSPSWPGGQGWVNGTFAGVIGGTDFTVPAYDVWAEQTVSDLPAANVSVTLASPSNTLPTYGAAWNATFSFPPNSDQFVTYSRWYTYDYLPPSVAGTQYTGVNVSMYVATGLPVGTPHRWWTNFVTGATIRASACSTGTNTMQLYPALPSYATGTYVNLDLRCDTGNSLGASTTAFNALYSLSPDPAVYYEQTVTYSPTQYKATICTMNLSPTPAVCIVPGGTTLVTFSESGLPNGATWSVALNGTQHSGTVVANASSIFFQLLNGTYTYSVSSVSVNNTTYYASPSSGSVTVDGAAKIVNITFSTTPPTSPPGLFTEGGIMAWLATWWIPVTVIVVALIIGLAVASRKRRGGR